MWREKIWLCLITIVEGILWDISHYRYTVDFEYSAKLNQQISDIRNLKQVEIKVHGDDINYDSFFNPHNEVANNVEVVTLNVSDVEVFNFALLSNLFPNMKKIYLIPVRQGCV